MKNIFIPRIVSLKNCQTLESLIVGSTSQCVYWIVPNVLRYLRYTKYLEVQSSVEVS